MSKPHSILIADQNDIIRRGIYAILSANPEFELLGDVDNGADLLRMVKQTKPDLLLMDLDFNDIDGIDLVRKIKRIATNLHIVVFTALQDEDTIMGALEAGVTSYLLKDIHSDQITQALLHASRGETVLHPLVATKVLNILIAPESLKHKVTSKLTKREVQVLKLVASGNNNQEIAQKLFISVSTAKAHVSNILGKLQLSDRTQAAAFAWETGLMQRER